MPTAYTSLLGLALPVTGELSGTWGTVVNNEITSLVEDAIANAASISVTSGNVTLTDNNGTSDQARMAILLVTGSPGVSRNIVAPSTSKWYIVKNGSNAAVVLKGSATTGVTIPAGAEVLAFWNGSDFEIAGMVGPSTSTDNAVARFDGTTGKVVQNSSVVIDDSNNITGIVDETLSGNLNFTGSAKRITGDFSNATVADRVMFQTSTTNGNTSVAAIPNGTSGQSNIRAFNNSDPTNASVTDIGTDASVGSFLRAERTGSGTYLPMAFYTGGSERMRIDTSGNINIPTLGARITGDFSNATLASRVAFQTSTANGNTTINAIPNGTGTNAQFVAHAGTDMDNSSRAGLNTTGTQSTFFSDKTGSGTYLPMTFYTGGSERMRIDTSGNVGIGTSSSGSPLTVKTDTDFVVSTRTTAASTGARIVALNAAQNAYKDLVIDGSQLIYAISGTERMRIDTSGNVGIGTNAPAYTLDIDKASANFRVRDASGGNDVAIRSIAGPVSLIGSVSNTPIGFTTNNTERMRITSGGEVYIAGTTDQGAYNLQVNGTGVWGAGAYVNGSDERLKDNIQTLNDGLSIVSQLRPVTFQYKPEHSKDQSIQPGFIAQELQQAMTGKSYLGGVVQSGPEYLNVAYQNFIPILTKAIQEQQAIIESLTARIAALESKGA